MHEIRITIPVECISEATRLAYSAGIERITVSEVRVNGQPRQMLSVETSTPQARSFVARFMQSPSLSMCDYSLTSREVRAIVQRPPQSIAALTLPVSEPQPDLMQDLWQLSHITPSYMGRASAGAILLADGLIHNNAVSIVVAALFLPFLSPVLGLAFGVWNRERALILQAGRAVLVSTVVALASGAVVAWMEGGPVRFDAFRGMAGNLLISIIVGTTAGLSIADDTGRRYLIGVAAAVQLAVFPVWFGIAFVIGLPAHIITVERAVSFFSNLVAISVSAMLSHAGMHIRTRSFPE